MTRAWHGAMAVFMFAAATTHAAPAAPSLAQVLARAGAYVSAFERQMSRLIAEERYEQVASYRDRPDERRTLTSDLLLVRSPDAHDWLQFRDVFDVDGQPVRDRAERLSRLFRPPSSGAIDRARELVNESARYNIGDILRTVNTPLFALKFLSPANQSRIKYKRSTRAIPATVEAQPTVPGAFRTTTEVWVVEYREHGDGTIIRTPDRKDLPSSGRFWIEPESGRVLMSELITENRSLRATIDVSYQSEPLVGMLMPIEMREAYEGRRSGSHIEGTATYGRFRQLDAAGK